MKVKKVKYAVIQLNSYFSLLRIDFVFGSFREAMAWAKKSNRDTNAEHYVLSRESGFIDDNICDRISLESDDKIYLTEKEDRPILSICACFDSIKNDFDSCYGSYISKHGEDNFGKFEQVCFK